MDQCVWKDPLSPVSDQQLSTFIDRLGFDLSQQIAHDSRNLSADVCLFVWVCFTVFANVCLWDWLSFVWTVKLPLPLLHQYFVIINQGTWGQTQFTT